MFCKVCNHREIDPNKKYGLIIERVEKTSENDDEFAVYKPMINFFGGFMSSYEPDNPGVPIVPIVIGQISPGMLMSYISALTTMAVEILKDTNIPEEILRELLKRAIDEGLNGKVVLCKCQH